MPRLAGAFLVLALILTAAAALALDAELVIEGLTTPVRLVSPPGDERLFVVEKSGYIRIYDQAGVFEDVFLDIRTGIINWNERGLLGLTFPPDHATTRRFYVCYTDTLGDTRVVRYLVDDQTGLADAASADTVLTVDQPFANHNGGHLEFGPDGMLYIGLGDGGSGGDPQNNAQNPQSLLGKMLRIDVSGSGYTIPPDNPEFETPTLGEIWAIGLRNPWCFSFDRETGDLYIADVGQNALEEIDVQPASSIGGENYGWKRMEGSACYSPGTGCDDGTLVYPVHEYTHGGNPYRCSISGGYVYRGPSAPSVTGQYIFSDYCSNQIWSFEWTESGGAGPVTDWTASVTPPSGFGSISSFGQDDLGNVYILDHDRGKVYRLIDSESGVSDVPSTMMRLEQNVPNPFNPFTEIAYTLDDSGRPARLQIFDAAGRLVRTLADSLTVEGEGTITWDGTDNNGNRVSAGPYIYRLQQGETVLSRKMMLVE